jgi:glutathione S-transferase
MHGPDYARINPMGKVPAIEDDGFVLTESGAITQYLLARYGDGRLETAPRPALGSAGHSRFLQWCFFAEATMMPPLGALVRQSRRPEAERNREIVADAEDKAARMLRYCDGALSETDYILGPVFTAADIMLGYSLALADHLGLVGATCPHVRAYLDALATRPAFREAMAA